MSDTAPRPEEPQSAPTYAQSDAPPTPPATAYGAVPTGGYSPEQPQHTTSQPAQASSPFAGPSGSPAEASPARDALGRIRTEIGKAVVGQDRAVTGLVIALLCKGHVLLEGVPGVAKTLLVRTMAQTLGLEFSRVQFTPDLMPGDVTGSLVYDARTAAFSFREGPVFTNLLLADEINRTPPKTQSSLLESMEERQVTVDGDSKPLPDPFLVIATQNPIEYEGTYPLPEAQLDRFMLKLPIGLPERSDEASVLRRHADGFNPRDLAAAGVTRVASAADLEAGRREMALVEVSDDIINYVVDIARATREMPSVSLGVSPRGATALIAASRAWAWMRGRTFVSPDDVKALAAWTLAHRMQLRPEAELEGVTRESVLTSVLASVPVPR
ncbi:AAA family ATPase [Demequina sp. TTPB684]|uniref:AAA family ATPase n=1 Tax=unclassified Demequina TaxID=2620311 RepID=UPI001CF38C15|nr:AAA family ATPase [Demequina sp. TMPB413]MCB2413591.1 AAA family ATPase [Demequina sp. TTPB684]UPU88556.1 AAA family ATPase [Demequina sp. TMPB413]